MHSKTVTSFMAALVATAISTSTVLAVKDNQQVPLSVMGQKLEAKYAKQLETLKKEISKDLPTVNDQKKAAFLKARKEEVAAEAKIKAAQKGMNGIKSAKGLVGHAKGKWIEGSNKGIAGANAMLKKATTDAERDAAMKELAKWQQNLKDGQDALKERQAKLDKVEKDRPRLEKILKESELNLTSARAATLKAFKGIDLKPYISTDMQDNKLAKYVVLLEATPRSLAVFAQQGEEQEELVETLLSSRDLLPLMVIADGARDGKYGRAMEILNNILNVAHGALRARDKSLGPLHHLAIAISLENMRSP